MRIASKFLTLLDFLMAPLVYLSALVLRPVRRIGVHKLSRCKSALVSAGIFPIRNHYYEPQFDHSQLSQPFSQDRVLPGISWNTAEQLDVLQQFKFSAELADVRSEVSGPLEFCLNNNMFLSGDAEYWYQIIRLKKPSRIFEIGSGHSTLMAMKAIRKSKEFDPGYRCKHVCIEPYETDWLETAEVTVIRKRIEELSVELFSELEENDVLFIDSSHIIRPQGDVLFEYLELLPSLRKGVIVHVHDIFSPKNYPAEWLQEKVLFWNEQYLLEAFLSNNSSWKIIGALNFLHHNFYAELKSVAPFLTPEREPGSFYIQKIA